MTITTKIGRQGGAVIVTVPQVGDQLSLTASDEALVTRPMECAKPRYTLNELLRGADDMERLAAETAGRLDGDAVGREIG